MESWFEIKSKKCCELALAWLQVQGFDPAKFGREPFPPSFRIVHLPTQEYFAFGGEDGGAKWTRPGFNLRISQTSIGPAESWDLKLQKFKRWTLDLREYLTAVEKPLNPLTDPAQLITERPSAFSVVEADLRTVGPTASSPITAVDLTVGKIGPIASSPVSRTVIPAPGKSVVPSRVRTEGQIVFIAHGRAKDWLELRKFLRKTLHLGSVEFNSESAAGIPTQERLQEMLEQATFAFLVMTGEDEHADGRTHARENVIHEAGLFQAKLGFRKAILLIEDGCERPSNIHGLTHIGFPKGLIRAAFRDVQKVLERERIV